MVVGLGPLLDVGADCSSVCTLCSGHALPLDEVLEAPARSGSRDRARSLHRDLPVVGILEEGRVDRRLGRRIGRAQRDRADALRPQVAGVDRDPVALDPQAPVVDDVRGQAMDLDVRRADAGARAAGRRRPRPRTRSPARSCRAGTGCRAGGLVPAILAVVADGRRLGREIDIHVVLEVLADARQVVDDLEPERAQLVGRPDAGQQQQPRRVDRAAARRRPRRRRTRPRSACPWRGTRRRPPAPFSMISWVAWACVAMVRFLRLRAGRGTRSPSSPGGRCAG